MATTKDAVKITPPSRVAAKNIMFMVRPLIRASKLNDGAEA